ncbi:MAG: Na+/H+ antiporter NhaC [Gammaproteobacteria bacterium]|jgi:NhaC family Na+:H+ antiporter|nr:Na+/H+ antiporter NhaC [Gammaproteobacteria bacterium]MBT3858901.1 Na+/H+ antiporter NhaC [Gammaproteobacteria bacterium]MBT3988229.1 Na+/H+ antiporter NhaC [Gammaproteobacteria bacterium]MBT4255579.1 Na+/H+ antiporter NhaC [Gammaproteobacteria bacterium]MBT4582499.1 Na+/H+ antiporter NhaC [Gammaproteobacteria bacterium]
MENSTGSGADSSALPFTPSLLQALIPVIVLVSLLSLSVYLFGDNASSGANQIALCVGAAIAAMIGWNNGMDWEQIETSIVSGITIALKPILILYCVGCLIGAWILSGTVPTMIYYSLLLLDPSIFYAASCLICGLIALSIGSSWTVAGTVGIALIGAAAGLGLSVEITAGAIISGAYFGDKMSPLSETTNLAPAVAGTDLFSHIGHMVWTTIPSIVIALILYTIIGLSIDTESSAEDLAITMQLITENFTINPVMLFPVFALLFMANKKWPPIPTILAGAMIGLALALIFQSSVVLTLAGDTPNMFLGLFKGIWQTLFEGFTLNSGNATLDDLMTRGGMSSMLNTTWLVLCAMVFGGVMDHTGLLKTLVNYALSFVHSTGSLIATTVLTCIGANIITSDQYISIVLPGRMYKLEYQNRNLDAKNLSRSLEDAGTMTSPLIPWNTCGAYMSGTLGVATFAYLPYCFFNLICPVVAVIYGFLNIKIAPLEDEQVIAVEPA